MTDKNKSESLIRFHSANKIDSYIGGGAGRKKEKKKIPKDSIEQVKT